MPSFYKEVNVDEWIDVDVDIDVEEFYEGMDESDCKEMVRLLRTAGYSIVDVDSNSADGEEFQEALRKLAANYYSLSNQDIAPIIQLAKRF